MRAYLLGQLAEEEAAALEAEYFLTRSTLLRLQSVEDELIEDYLDGNLRPAEQQLFERRYFQVPELRRKVEEVRRSRGVLPQARREPVWASWRLALAAGLILAFGLGIWVYRTGLIGPGAENRKQPIAQNDSSVAQQPNRRVFALIYLVPGLTKGATSRAVEFAPPPADSTIDLVLELPGAPEPANIRIAQVKADGNTVEVWSSPHPLQPTSVHGLRPGFIPLSDAIPGGSSGLRQAITLAVPGSKFQPGDYIVEARAPHGEIRERYVYRVNKPH